MFTQCWVPFGEGQSGRHAVSGVSLGDRSARAPGALGATESKIFSFHFDLSLNAVLPALYLATGAPIWGFLSNPETRESKAPSTEWSRTWRGGGSG